MLTYLSAAPIPSARPKKVKREPLDNRVAAHQQTPHSSCTATTKKDKRHLLYR